MAKQRGTKRDGTQPMGQRGPDKRSGRGRKKTAPLMKSAVDGTVVLDDDDEDVSPAPAKVTAQQEPTDRNSSAPPAKASDPGDTEDARQARRQRRLDAQLLAALYNTTDEEMTRFRRLRLGRESSAPLDALMRGRELLEVLVQALRAGDDSDAWDDLDLALRTARGQGAAESMDSLPHRRLKDALGTTAPLVSARPTPVQLSGQPASESWAHHPASAAHAQPLPSSAQHMGHHSGAQTSHAAAQQHAAQTAQQAAAQQAAAQQAAAQQAAAQQAAAQQAAAQQAAAHQAAAHHAAAQHAAAQHAAQLAGGQSPHAAGQLTSGQHTAAQHAAAQQQAAAQQAAASQQPAVQPHHGHGAAAAHPHNPQAQHGAQAPAHGPMSAAQHTQRSPWGQGQWPQGYAGPPAAAPGQAYAPGSLPVTTPATPASPSIQNAYASPPAGYAGHASPQHTGAQGTMPHGGPAAVVPQAAAPSYPVHPAGAPYPDYSDPSSRTPHDGAMDGNDTREPTPPLFKAMGSSTMVAPASTREGGGTIPPVARTEPPPPEADEPAPQSTTSPNTPMPDPSPSPPPAEVTPPANRDGDALANGLDSESTLQAADLTQPVKRMRPFVEDGKTTQLSFTSHAHPFALSLEQYAALCAERDMCGDDAERERKIHKRYEIADKRARSLVDRLFQLRFETDPDAEAEWRRYYASFKTRLANAPPSSPN